MTDKLQISHRHPELDRCQTQFNTINNAFKPLLLTICEQIDSLNALVLTTSDDYHAALTQEQQTSEVNEHHQLTHADGGQAILLRIEKRSLIQAQVVETRAKCNIALDQLQQFSNRLSSAVNIEDSKDTTIAALQARVGDQSRLIQSLNHKNVELNMKIETMNGNHAQPIESLRENQQPTTVVVTTQRLKTQPEPFTTFPGFLPFFQFRYPPDISHSSINQLLYLNNADLTALHQYMKQQSDQIWGQHSPLTTSEAKWHYARQVLLSILNSEDCVSLLQTPCDGFIELSTRRKEHAFEYLRTKCGSNFPTRDTFPSFVLQIQHGNAALSCCLVLQLLGFTSTSWFDPLPPTFAFSNSTPSELSFERLRASGIAHRYSTLSMEILEQMLGVIGKCVERCICLASTWMYLLLLGYPRFQHERLMSTRDAICAEYLRKSNEQRNEFWERKIVFSSPEEKQSLVSYSFQNHTPVVDQLPDPEGTSKSTYRQLIYSENHQLTRLCEFLERRTAEIWTTNIFLSHEAKFYAVRNTLISLLVEPTYVELLSGFGDLGDPGVEPLPTEEELRHAHESLVNKYDFWPREYNKSAITQVVKQIMSQNSLVVRCLILKLCGATYAFENATEEPFELHVRSLENTISQEHQPHFLQPERQVVNFKVSSYDPQQFSHLSAKAMVNTMTILSQLPWKRQHVALLEVSKQLRRVRNHPDPQPDDNVVV